MSHAQCFKGAQNPRDCLRDKSHICIIVHNNSRLQHGLLQSIRSVYSFEAVFSTHVLNALLPDKGYLLYVCLSVLTRFISIRFKPNL